MTGFWNELKYFFEVLWGDSWSGYGSVGRWLTLAIVACVVALVIAGVRGAASDRRFVASCHARGGHVHYKSRSVPGIGIIVGNVVLPTQSSVTTMTFAPGKESDCEVCR